jgi:nucleoside-diphosphate-sugar epimerase
VFDTTKPVGVHSRAADLGRCRQRLGWEPGTRFADGLARTIDWYRKTHELKRVKAELDVLLTER